jgi:hypothetical protein
MNFLLCSFDGKNKSGGTRHSFLTRIFSEGAENADMSSQASIFEYCKDSE